MVDVEWEEEPGQGYRRAKASTIHGWVTKLRGTLLGNERTRQRGITEMQVASAVRQYQRERKASRRKRKKRGGFFSFLTPSRHRSKSRSRRDRDRSTSVRERDYGHRREGRWLHFPHRARPHHYGHGTRLRGMMTGNRDAVLIGRAMNDSARREREKERRRRKRRVDREARAVKAEGSLNKWAWRG